MLVAAAAAGEGWKVLYLGANLPAADIVAAAQQSRASAVALSVVYVDGDSMLRELRETASGLSAETLLLMGGMAAARLGRAVSETRVRVLTDLDSLRELLRARRMGSPSIAAD